MPENEKLMTKEGWMVAAISNYADLEEGRVPDTCPLLENSNLLKEKNSNFTSKIFFDLTIVENKSDIHVNI